MIKKIIAFFVFLVMISVTIWSATATDIYFNYTANINAGNVITNGNISTQSNDG